MSIDKDSNGLPEVNVHKRTTKVNLWMVAWIAIFLVLMAAVAVWFSRSNPRSAPPPPAEKAAEGTRP